MLNTKVVERINSNDVLEALGVLSSIIAEAEKDKYSKRMHSLRVLSMLSAVPDPIMYDAVHAAYTFDQMVEMAALAYNSEAVRAWLRYDSGFAAHVCSIGANCNTCPTCLQGSGCKMLGHTRFNMS